MNTRRQFVPQRCAPSARAACLSLGRGCVRAPVLKVVLALLLLPLLPLLPLARAAPRVRTQEGPVFSPESPPVASAGWQKLCAPQFAFCLWASPGTSREVSLATLDDAEQAWAAITGPLHSPAPEGPVGDRWAIYLVDRVPGGFRVPLYGRDPIAHGDRASSFALVDRHLPLGCALRLATARAVARGSLWTATPSVAVGSAIPQAEALAELATPCVDAGTLDDIAAFQAEPEACIVDPTSSSFDRGAGRFFDWLDTRFAAEPGLLLVGSWALAQTNTAAAAWRWSAAPTLFDVLSRSLPGSAAFGPSFDDALVRFAIARLAMDPPPRPAWRLPWPQQARRLADPVPVAPTGAVYVEVDRASEAQSALRLEIEWEDYGRMRWTAAKLDDQGALLGVIPIVSTTTATRAAMTLEALEHVKRLVIVGVNVGSTEHAFDPDAGEWERHGWLLTVDPNGQAR